MMRTYNPAKIHTFDVENTTLDPATVFMWASTRFTKPTAKDTVTGSTIKELVNYIFSQANGSLFYAHNLKHDISFVIAYLMNEAKGPYKISNEIIDQLSGKVKTVEISYKGKKIEFRDSLSLIPLPLADGMRAFTDLKKGGDTPLFETIEEAAKGVLPIHWDYCVNDSMGLARMLIAYFDKGEGKAKFTLTIASASKANLQAVENQGNPKRYKTLFAPIPLEMDRVMRKAYRGALTFVNPKYQSINKIKILNDVVVADANSMYPYQMIKRLPKGEPKVVEEGDVNNEMDNFWDLGIQKFTVKGMYAKEGKFPFMTQGNCPSGFAVYITNADEESHPNIEERTFYLTLQEFEYFKENYDYEGLELCGGWVFRSRDKAFKAFVDKFWEMKLSKDLAVKSLGKLILNSAYGKFAESPERVSCQFVMTDDGLRIVEKDEDEQKDDKSRGYLPAGIFITSMARCDMLMNIKRIGFDNIVYGDTDSLHIIDPTEKYLNMLYLHKKEIGKWDHEHTFKRAVYLKPKRYCGEYIVNGEVKLKNVAAGIKKNSLNEAIKRLEDFVPGKEIVCPQFYLGKTGMATRERAVKI